MPASLKSNQALVSLASVFVLFSLMIGPRHEVGGDLQTHFSYFLSSINVWYLILPSVIAVFALARLSLAIGPYSTAVDRVALCLIPIQLFMLARIPRLAQYVADPHAVGGVRDRLLAAVLFVWLNFATHAFAWAPYQ